jgi:hypothetical protein
MKRIISFAVLFLSLSTLICCALPALFVMLGAGAAFASLLGIVPQLIWFSEYKGIVFGTAGILLVTNLAIRLYVPQRCPSDRALADECERAQRISEFVFKISLGAYLMGGFFAFVAPIFF